MAATLQRVFSNAFSFIRMKKIEFRFNCHSYQQATSIGSDNGLASNRQQYINWTNSYLFTEAYMCQSALKSKLYNHRIKKYQLKTNLLAIVFIILILSLFETLFRLAYYTPASTKLKVVHTSFTLSVRLSVCGHNRVRTVSSQQYSSDPFHICTSYQSISEGMLRVKFYQIQSFVILQIP